VIVRSVSGRELSEEWKLPGGKQVNCLLFGIKNASGMIRART